MRQARTETPRGTGNASILSRTSRSISRSRPRFSHVSPGDASENMARILFFYRICARYDSVCFGHTLCIFTDSVTPFASAESCRSADCQHFGRAIWSQATMWSCFAHGVAARRVAVTVRKCAGQASRKRSSSVTTLWTRPECLLRLRPAAATRTMQTAFRVPVCFRNCPARSFSRLTSAESSSYGSAILRDAAHGARVRCLCQTSFG